MKLPKFDYAKPGSVSECCTLLREHGPTAIPVAGGTDLMMALKHWLKIPEIVVDLCGIPGLNGITERKDGGLNIGALATLCQLAGHDLVRKKYPVLAKAARDVGSRQLQAMGTIGGNLCQDTCCLYYNRPPMLRQGLGPCLKLDGDACHAVRGSKDCWATYCGDLAPVLMVLNAVVKISDASGDAVIPVHRLFSGDGKQPCTLQPGQVVTEIQVPAPAAHSAAVYLKMRIRKAIDYPLLGVALHLALQPDKKTVADIALVLTAVEKAPIMIAAAEELKGKTVTDDLIDGLAEAAFKKSHPINNTYGYTPGYRKNMARTYVKEAVRRSIDLAAGDGGAA
ncbi:MAG: FAD binding domain-containing protein [Desulfobacterales bacterium]|nr:FAD binding domain-containing protein [Desulfobacterales bacterium]